jgi:hypothetical protein
MYIYEYRKNSSSLPNPAGLYADLTLSQVFTLELDCELMIMD